MYLFARFLSKYPFQCYLYYMAVLAENRKVRFDYEILETLEAGLVLRGQEVKSVSLGRINLAGSYVVIRGKEAFLLGASIPAYQPKNVWKGYQEDRTRKLLLHKKELSWLLGKTKERGLTLLPLRVYTKGATIKLEIALAKGRKMHDKRTALRKRETQREIEQAIKRG